MINANFIVIRIDRTCDIIGGKENFNKSMYYNVMGYNHIIKELNQLSNQNVASIIFDLHQMGSIYKDFSEHILNGGVLGDKFFLLNDEFEEEEDNIRKIIKEKSGTIKNETFNSEDVLEKENDILKNVYNKNKKLFINKTSHIDDESKEQYDKSAMSFNSEFEKRKELFEKKINPTIYNWIQTNVPNLSDEDYGMLMSLIYKTRNQN